MLKARNLKPCLITRKKLMSGGWRSVKKSTVRRVPGKGNLKEIQDCFTLLVITACEKGDMTGRELR